MKTNRIHSFYLCGLGLAVPFTACAAGKQASFPPVTPVAPGSPNILWIYTDEHRPDSYGCYGSAWAQTPTTDKIASRGVVMQNHYVQSPASVPSRASLLYARYPQELGVYDNRYYYKDGVLDPNLVPFHKLFENNGYQTANFGKWHVPGSDSQWGYNDPFQFTRYFGPQGCYDPKEEEGFRMIHRPNGTPLVLGGTYPQADIDRLNGGTIASELTDRALRWLDGRDTVKPFLLRVSYAWPHTPSTAPAPFDKLYEGKPFPRPYLNAAQKYQNRSNEDKALSNEQGGLTLSESDWEWICQTYYGLVAYLDTQYARLFDYLEQNGMLENTIIVISADHGRNLGEYGACEKSTFDHEVWRVPFILSYPKKVPQGVVRHDLSEHIDHARTLLGLAGIEAPAEYRGRNLFNPAEPEPDAVYGMLDRGNIIDLPNAQKESNRGKRRLAIRTKDYRYDFMYTTIGGIKITNPAKWDASLYKISTDPDENNNLINDPAYAAIASELHNKLVNWFESLPYRSDGN